MVVGQFKQETNLVVLGGGAGGYAAALQAAGHGVQTIIVDPAGTSAHFAWLTSRTLADAGRLIRNAEHAAQYGLGVIEPTLDLVKLRQWTQQIGEALRTRLEQLCQTRGVEVIRGLATFESGREIMVHGNGGARVHFRRAIIATGSSPLPPSGGWPKLPQVTGASGVLDLDRLPAALLVIGGSHTALELAGACAALGSAVTLATPDTRLLPDADADLARPLERRLGRRLDELALATTVSSMQPDGDGVEVELRSRTTTSKRRFDHVMVALGGAPSTEGLDLSKAQVTIDDDGSIRVDEQLRTSNPRIFAIGDVTGRPMVANRAIHQGRVAADVAAGIDNAFQPQAIPFVVFSDPEVAWCGLTEQQAKAQGIAHEVARIDWAVSGRAVSLAQTDGLTRLVLDPDSKLVLGAGIVGSGAAEMIGEAALAIEMGAVADDLAAVIHAHPTMSELMTDAAGQASR